MNPNDRRIVSFSMLGHALFHTYELSIPVFVVLAGLAVGALLLCLRVVTAH